MMMVVGGGIIPLIQNWVADVSTYMFSYIVPLIGLIPALLCIVRLEECEQRHRSRLKIVSSGSLAHISRGFVIM